MSQKIGRNYRLPSEAEWEYVCRAGTTTPFHFGATLTSNLANYRGTSIYQSEPQGKYRQQTTEVGSFPPNAFGLYDMHGNVWEWCKDDWHDSYNDAPKNGTAWISASTTKVVQSGSWNNNPRSCRSAYRLRFNADNRNNNIGLRVVCSSARALSIVRAGKWEFIGCTTNQESRPVLAMEVTLFKNKTRLDSLVGYYVRMCEELSDLQLILVIESKALLNQIAIAVAVNFK